MVQKRSVCLLGAAMMGVAFLPVPEVPAQYEGSSSLRITKIDARKLVTPRYRENNPGSSSGGDWYRITTEYDTAPGWLDELSITYYLLFEPDLEDAMVRNPASNFLLLRGETEYVNVRQGSHISEVYVHANTIARYGKPERVGVVFKSQGRLLGKASEPGVRGDWWEQLAPIDGLILERGQTPYNPTSPDHYEAMKASEGRR